LEGRIREEDPEELLTLQFKDLPKEKLAPKNYAIGIGD
jgi:hypothetical protein